MHMRSFRRLIRVGNIVLLNGISSIERVSIANAGEEQALTLKIQISQYRTAGEDLEEIVHFRRVKLRV